MSLIDWSDPEEMLGLLVEYVADEAIGENDPDRAAFLRELWRDLEDLSSRQFAAVDGIADAICEIRATQPAEFLNDGAITHVDACVEGLRRIGSHTTGARAVELGRCTGRQPAPRELRVRYSFPYRVAPVSGGSVSRQ